MSKKQKDSNSEQENRINTTLHKPTLEDILEFAEGISVAEESQQDITQQIHKDSDDLLLSQVPGSYEQTNARTLLPDTESARDILKSRAQTMAQLEDESGNVDHFHEFLRFRLGEREEYGIPYEYLEEILYMPAITQVPCTPEHIVGVVNRRGEMLTVLGLKTLFQTIKTGNQSEARIIVVSVHDMRIGILVDEVISNERYNPEQLAPPLVSAGVTNPDYVKGIYNGKVTMLNIEAMLSDSLMIVDETV